MDATTPPQPPDRVAHFLRTEEVLWLSTFGTDGFPGLVPIWFSWDGASILLASKPPAEKVADMRAEPRVMVALGNAEEDFDVGLVEARAELPDTPVDAFLPESHWAKYASDLASIGLTREEYLRSYSQAVRLVPVRDLGWHGRTEPRGRRDPRGRGRAATTCSATMPALLGSHRHSRPTRVRIPRCAPGRIGSGARDEIAVRTAPPGDPPDERHHPVEPRLGGPRQPAGRARDRGTRPVPRAAPRAASPRTPCR
ncbi:MAG: pyridoxamine 5'-phosphate oxidase family protein [Chloroflexota bacterium]